MKRRTKFRDEGPFTIYAVAEDTLDGTPDLLGYNIEGPGADPSWLFTEEQLEHKLEELKAEAG
jgi:hypothetical protein